MSIAIRSRRSFIGGSDARIIMGDDGPEDLSGNLIVQLGSATEGLNRQWYERNGPNSPYRPIRSTSTSC